MPKRKQTEEVSAIKKEDPKKAKQSVKRGKAAAKTPAPEKQAETKGSTAKNCTSKSRVQKKRNASLAEKKSKYFVEQKVSDESEDETDSSPQIPVRKNKNSKMAKEKVETKIQKDDDSDESDDDEWEEVEELAIPSGSAAMEDEPKVPSEPLEIEIETVEAKHKRTNKEKKQDEFQTYLRRVMKRYNKEMLEDMHKVHLLCLLASGLFRNRLCCKPDLIAITLSLVPVKFTRVAVKQITTDYLEDLLKWFKTTFTLNSELTEDNNMDLHKRLEKRLESLSARNHQEMTYLFLLVLRSLHLFSRLILSLQPLSFKPGSVKVNVQILNSCHSTTEVNESEDRSPEPKDCKTDKSEEKAPELLSPGLKRPSSDSSENKKIKGGKRQKKNEKVDEEMKSNEEIGHRRSGYTRRRSSTLKVSYKEDSSDNEELSDGDEFKPYSEDDESDAFESEAKPFKNEPKSKEKPKSQTSRQPTGNKKRIKKEDKIDLNELEELKGTVKQNKPRNSSGPRRRVKKEEGEELDELENMQKVVKGEDEWLEVYLEKSKKWVCLDVDHGVGRPELCINHATQPITYVVGVDNDDYLKDLSRRYDPTWLTASRKRRIVSDWWEETLQFFESPNSERKEQEDKELQENLLDKPLPTSITEYKNHPLYVLERHILKYQALYPPTAAILGYCRGEAVYSRDCIHTLHSRDTWLKQARTVRLAEEPYKMVRGFSNSSRKARMMTKNKNEKDLPLFGLWQTEEYQPPVAIDGKVPRNTFGNVYLFQPCMLPVGCVHVRLSNLHRVARKLNLDCASAVTGFDHHGGYSHAVTDGYIVCKEDEEVLRDAWQNEQEILRKKEQEKREKRVLANWALLVKGLLIKQRLERRYGQQGREKDTGIAKPIKEDAGGFSSDEDGEAKSQTAPPSLAMSWPQNRQDEEEENADKKSVSKRERRGRQKNLFPFEKI